MKKLIFTLLTVLILTTPSWAEGDGTSECGESKCALWNWSQEARASESYLPRAAGMLTDGVYRVVKSPFKLLKTFGATAFAGETHPANPVGWVHGLGKGVVKAVDLIGTGATNIVGSLIPGANGLETICPFNKE